MLLSERADAAPLRTVLEAGAVHERAADDGRVRVSLAVGPEGGWTDRELAEAAAAGFREASLGSNILRTETAVAAGLAAAHLFFDD